MTPEPTPPPGAAKSLELTTLLAADSRPALLAGVREACADANGHTVAHLRTLLGIATHFEALLERERESLLAEGADAEARDAALGVRRLYFEIANGFQGFLRQADVWIQAADAPPLARIIGIAMHCAHEFAKWGRLLGEPGAAWPWKALHALYTLAESQECEREDFALLRDDTGPTNVAALFIASLLLERLDASNLSRRDYRLADEALRQWSGDCRLQEDRGRAHGCLVDLASEAGLKPIRGTDLPPSARYLDAEGLKVHIERARAEPDQAAARWAALLGALETLYRSVAGGRENRTEERSQFVDQVVEVAIGVEAIVRRVHASAEPEPLVFRLSEEGDAPPAPVDGALRWRAQDLTTASFGLLASPLEAAGVERGSLIALRNQETRGWMLGNVVRKVESGRGDILVGIEILTYRPVAVTLEGPGHAPVLPAIFLPGTDPTGKGDALLLPLGTGTTTLARDLRVGTTRYRTRMTSRLRRGADWETVEFVVEAATGQMEIA